MFKKQYISKEESNLNTNKFTSFSKFCFKSLNILFYLLFSWLFFNLLFINRSFMQYNIFKQITAAVLLLTAMIIGYILIKFIFDHLKAFKKFFKNYSFVIIGFSLFVLFAAQLIYIRYISTPIGWDCGHIIAIATSDDMNAVAGASNYFSNYYNNLFLLFGMRLLNKIFTFLQISDMWFGLSVLNVIVVDVAILFTVLASKKLFSLKTTYLTLLLSVLLTGFLPYLIVPYSDTLPMPIIAVAFYLYLSICSSKKILTKIILSSLCGILIAVGYLLKPTTIIIMIAVVLVHSIFYLHSPKLLLRSGIMVLVGLITFSCVNVGFNTFIKNQKYLEINESIKVPMTHFFMMGLSTWTGDDGGIRYGAWYGNDVGLTLGQPNTQAMKEANIKKIKERLKEYGAIGTLKQWNNKLCWVTSEGSFFWGYEGSFNMDGAKDSVFKELLDRKEGSLFGLYKYASQSIWIVTLLGLILPMFFRKKDWGQKNILLLRCSVIGILLFLMFFEARSRYLILYFPCFILLSSYGLRGFLEYTDHLFHKLVKKRKRQQKPGAGACAQ